MQVEPIRRSFAPTIIVNGVTTVTNPSTAPSPTYVDSSTNYVNFDNPGIIVTGKQIGRAHV